MSVWFIAHDGATAYSRGERQYAVVDGRFEVEDADDAAVFAKTHTQTSAPEVASKAKAKPRTG